MAPVTLSLVAVELMAGTVEPAKMSWVSSRPRACWTSRVSTVATSSPALRNRGKDVAFFQRLVEALDEVVDDLGAVVDGRSGRGHAGVDAADGCLVDQQDPLEDAMFSHQVDIGWVVQASRRRPRG
jgi:hypothetical protein